MDLENLDIKIDKEDKAMIILNFLPKSSKNFKETLKYSRATISINDVQNALNYKMLDMKVIKRNNSNGEGLVPRGRS